MILSHTFNTRGHGYAFGDEFKHTLSYQFRVWPLQFDETKDLPSYVFLGIEANGTWQQKDNQRGVRLGSTGGYTLFLSPTLQWIGKRLIAETSIQLPVIQELNGQQPKTRFVLTTGFRVQF